MSAETVATRIWLLLVGLTLLSAALADGGVPGALTALIALGVAGVKGALVIRHFMELDGRFPRLRQLMNGYIVLVPALLFVLGSVFAQ
ncbi:cytochrome C oxidase subunit IV family protein [Denitromonas halophila]|uniref:Thiosulfate reductase n=1 Tax=Denitromonas halophila TaxID=1629404 RepID=A0A557QEP4_9RHOO|nr:cytochrome C oxidase subunit IV family protein [Denitromonas halophila]TVO51371.1 thiosulfate reductase [Denitromonas halophila]